MYLGDLGFLTKLWFQKQAVAQLMWAAFALGLVFLIRPFNLLVLGTVPFLAGTSIVFRQGIKSALQQRKMLFIGDGAKKFQSICNHPNASFPESEHNTEHLSLISYNAFKNKKFEDLISVEPNYVKGFYSTQNK